MNRWTFLGLSSTEKKKKKFIPPSLGSQFVNQKLRSVRSCPSSARKNASWNGLHFVQRPDSPSWIHFVCYYIYKRSDNFELISTWFDLIDDWSWGEKKSTKIYHVLSLLRVSGRRVGDVPRWRLTGNIEGLQGWGPKDETLQMRRRLKQQLFRQETRG